MSALTFDAYPRMDPAEAGRPALSGYGTVEGVRLPCIVAGAASTLASSIDASAATLTLHDASRFPSAPFTLQAGYERMSVTAIDGNTLTLTRGVDGTEPEAHIKGEPAYEVPSEYVYLISDAPVHSVDAVYIDRTLQREGFTAYTGAEGNSHPSWPGKAVVVFSADSFIGAQRNIKAADVVTRKQGVSVDASPSSASHAELTDSSASSYITLSPTGTSGSHPLAWAGFGADARALRQTFKAVIENASASAEASLKAALISTSTGEALALRDVFIPAQSKVTLTIEHAGAPGAHLTLRPASGDVRVYSIACTTLRERTPSLADALITAELPASFYSDARLSDGISSSTLALSDSGLGSCFAAFISEGPGEVFAQTARATLKNPSSTAQATAVLMLVEGGTCLAMSKHTIGPLAEETLTLRHTGGGWGAHVRLVMQTGSLNVSALSKSVEYINDEALAEVSLKASSSARIVLGSEVTADVSWSVDATGAYSGLGQPIERPDHVIKHFLIERMGFSPSEIDNDSFDAAGAAYASAIDGGYRFGILLEGTRLASEWLRLMARESRSTLRYTGGKWQLDYIPEAAPLPVVIISQSELAGEGAEFTFSMEPMREVANLITGRFMRNMSPASRESAWLHTLEVSDADSVTRYGTRPMEVRLEAVRSAGMAAHVLEQMLRERSMPLLSVAMKVHYGHFGLVEPGATIELSDGLYPGKRFFVESVKRIDQATAEVRARQWWA